MILHITRKENVCVFARKVGEFLTSAAAERNGFNQSVRVGISYTRAAERIAYKLGKVVNTHFAVKLARYNKRAVNTRSVFQPENLSKAEINSAVCNVVIRMRAKRRNTCVCEYIYGAVTEHVADAAENNRVVGKE